MISIESSTWSLDGQSCSSLTYDSYMFEFDYVSLLSATRVCLLCVLLTHAQAVKETGHRFRETILALGGGKEPLDVRQFLLSTVIRQFNVLNM